ncbi:MAG: NAD(P)H-dependent oxidoreductase [Hyphomicrobiaceae bacterium]|nr:NAD(P)H-dependent oxidoreductase [Hyphomicrobiaceae bacterium]
MKVLWVFAHPEPRSLNGALRDFGVRTLTASGHEVRQSDLYAMRWKAVADADDFRDFEPGSRLTYASSSLQGFRNGTQTPDISAEQEKLMWADAIILQFPLWWFSVPAILKGWFDRVLAAGWAYRVPDPTQAGRSRRYGDGNLKGKRGLVIVSAGGSAAALGPRGAAGDINDLLFPVTYGILWYTGVAPLRPHVINDANQVGPDAYAQLETKLAARLGSLWTEAPIPYRSQNGGDYGDDLTLKPGLEGSAQGFAMRLRRDR